MRSNIRLHLFYLIGTLSLIGVCCCWAQNPNPQPSGIPVLPGVSGFGADTRGGMGGRIIEVTNLNKDGKGSFAEAIAESGPRIIVFGVGGVINLEGISLRITNPYLTIAGQTAPGSGITLIKGGLQVLTHDVILQHIRIRPGEAGHEKKGGWEVDGISTSSGANNVIIDHCTATWATDENMSASGPRFSGENPEEWRKNTSHRITISNCIIAHGLSMSTHSETEHSKGTLIHDNATEILLYGNLYAHNYERNPLCKGGSQVAIVNNFIYNPGRTVIHYALNENEWRGHIWLPGKLAIVGNYIEYGPNTREYIVPALFLGPVELYWEDNQVDSSSNERRFGIAYERQRPSGLLLQEINLLESMPLWPEGLKAMPSGKVKEQVLKNAGAFPWNRDKIDTKIIEGILDGSGRIIDSEKEAGGYPSQDPVFRKFPVEKWDMDKLIRMSGINACPELDWGRAKILNRSIRRRGYCGLKFLQQRRYRTLWTDTI